MLDPEKLIKELTLEEKIKILSGYDAWYTHKIERLNIPSLKMSDGPNGVRGDGKSGKSSACFPCAISVGSTWNMELVNELGQELGNEAKVKSVDVLLGPTINIHRHPLGGRHFECFSEDPFLTGKIATDYVNGVQSREVAACLKHFVGNDTEFERYTVSSNIDEKTLREIYLLPFEMAIKEANAQVVMSAYNKLNNIYCSSDENLLINILKNEWGFDGYVVSDWGAATETIENAIGGLDLEMPGPAVEVVNAQAGFCEQVLHCWNWADAHHRWPNACMGIAQNAEFWGEAGFLCRIRTGQGDGRGPVVEAGGIACRHSTIFLEHGTEAAERFHRCGFRVFVFGKGNHVAFHFHLYRHDLIVEIASFLRFGSTGLAFQCEGILRLPRYVVFAGHVFGRDAHVACAKGAVQRAQHHVERFNITHLRAPPLVWNDEGGEAHVFGTAREAEICIAQHQRLDHRHNRLNTGPAEAVDVHRGRAVEDTCLNRGGAAQIHVARLGVDDMAEGDVANLICRNTRALNRRFRGGGGQGNWWGACQ